MHDNVVPVSINLLIFLLSAFLGLGLIKKVSKLLHTPLMSLTNAISSVSVVAALIVMAEPKNILILTLATIAVALAATNVISGFMITERILRMFKKDNGGKTK
ncbi:MAG: NAD(P) transhydrogenase subunit alpha [Smithellaceae bacterium]|jgi:NAD(P) transhydrogenase subunit alpha|nr:NAD(P) transhydrogenase subunit alpha [Syntrophaceae bacterium]MDX9816809.1 NAD(P) transhydrogenase subunit alpha [Smithellaceae bacterium]NMD06056.1 NAD(P) transhydrogenase subunit alpha [Deltaproteobacteria bacterium]OPZ51815.1 MAG: NAD(P) transhydrogenase subunit alpha [Deltaproteobacteria bacterium ADurb.BinA014]MBP8608145.1 NAD(P) transhydrogenase subunit alpha [Syntrophaceae bacterium]